MHFPRLVPLSGAIVLSLVFAHRLQRLRTTVAPKVLSPKRHW